MNPDHRDNGFHAVREGSIQALRKGCGELYGFAGSNVRPAPRGLLQRVKSANDLLT